MLRDPRPRSLSPAMPDTESYTDRRGGAQVVAFLATPFADPPLPLPPTACTRLRTELASFAGTQVTCPCLRVVLGPVRALAVTHHNPRGSAGPSRADDAFTGVVHRPCTELSSSTSPTGAQVYLRLQRACGMLP